MAIARSAYRRYKVIDSMLRNTSKMYPTIKEIQAACKRILEMEPTLDTLEKDFRNMKMQEPVGFDAPIVYCRKNKGYYYTNPYFSINGVRLNESDINSIKEALELLQSIVSTRVSQSFNFALEKILVSYKEEFPEGNSKRKIIETESISGSRGFEHFDTLFAACSKKTPISFTYYSYEKRKFKAVLIHPVLLKEFDSFWYLLGYSESHKALQTFGFDRIYEPMLLNRKYIPIASEITNNYYKDIYGVFPIRDEPKQTIIFFTTPMVANYFEAYPIHESQVSKKNDAGCVFKLQVIPSIELMKLFRSYGTELMVMEPQWLKSELKR